MNILKVSAALAMLAAAFAAGFVLRLDRHATTEAAADREILYWVDPMHPAYKSDKPGIAPDCGMALEPVYADDGRTGGTKPNAAHPALPALPAQPAPPARESAIRITPERQQLIGVKFATAEWDDSGRALRTVGTVTFDERRVAHVHPRIEGWIDKVFVDFTGDLVKVGQPMLTIYSPEMLASQQELLLAARARKVMADNPLSTAAEHGQSLFEAAKRRLELWDLSGDQIEEVLATGRPIRSITLHAPMGGFVLERNAFPNQRVGPDADLYTIADLSRVWIMADVFESDIASIHVGSAAYLMFPYEGTTPVGAKVMYIQPQVDPTTRTLKVRLEAANPGLRLKPDMFVNVEFGIAGEKRLVVPADAVLDSGERQTVFVDLGDGYLEPRAVDVGARIGDRIVIASGLAAGERVVASGTFLVDSESQLKAAIGAMGAPGRRFQAPSTPSSEHIH
jgi:RND family efflux transporter MFP subunit